MRAATIEAGCDMGVVREVISLTQKQWTGRRYAPLVCKVIRCHWQGKDVSLADCRRCGKRKLPGGD